MTKPMLFVIDMINDCFIHEPMIRRRVQLCAAINDLILYARENGFHIVWVRQEFEDDLSDAFLEMREQNIRMYIKGTPGPQLLDELIPIDGEHEIIKKRYSMFHGTNLDSLLQELNPAALILAGVNTHACIRMAAIDAYQRDYRSIIVEECVYSPNEEHHRVSLEYLGNNIANVISLAKVKEIPYT